jgi:hypothetical protein
MADRWSTLREFPLPAVDAAAMAQILRWLMAAVVLSVLVWAADRRLRRWLERGEPPRPEPVARRP